MRKTHPDIHPRNKCAKFQPNPTIFESPGYPKVFGTRTQTDRQTFSDFSSTEVENKKRRKELRVGCREILRSTPTMFYLIDNC